MHITELAQPVSTDQVGHIVGAFTSAFGRAPSAEFRKRLNEKRKLSVLIAGVDSVDGFKIGYERSQLVFFSWLGGVKTECQRQGVARALLRHQHRLCSERGYHEIQTEIFADTNGMLLLNLQEGFGIYGTRLGDDNRLRVQLKKTLAAT